MRKYKISPGLKNRIRKILLLREIPFKIESEGDQIYVSVPLSGQRFHKIVQRARCEQLTEETGIMHLTKEESESDLKIAFLMHQYDKGSFVVKNSKQQG